MSTPMTVKARLPSSMNRPINPRIVRMRTFMHFLLGLRRACLLPADRLDGGDLLADGSRNRRDARARRRAVQVDGARAAERHPASELRSGHAEDIAQGPQQPRVVRYVDGQQCAIHV